MTTMQAFQSSGSSLKQSYTDIQFLPVEFLLQEEVIAIASLPQATNLHNNQSNRCLAHCWLDDDQREQGQRCLVACWQSAHHDHGAHSCSHGCTQDCGHTATVSPLPEEMLLRVGLSHPCHCC